MYFIKFKTIVKKCVEIFPQNTFRFMSSIVGISWHNCAWNKCIALTKATIRQISMFQRFLSASESFGLTDGRVILGTSLLLGDIILPVPFVNIRLFLEYIYVYSEPICRLFFGVSVTSSSIENFRIFYLIIERSTCKLRK